MTTLTVRKLTDDVRRAAGLRAAEHGRSTEGEVRAILAEAGLTDEDLTVLEQSQRQQPAAVPVNLDGARAWLSIPEDETEQAETSGTRQRATDVPGVTVQDPLRNIGLGG